MADERSKCTRDALLAKESALRSDIEELQQRMDTLVSRKKKGIRQRAERHAAEPPKGAVETDGMAAQIERVVRMMSTADKALNRRDELVSLRQQQQQQQQHGGRHVAQTTATALAGGGATALMETMAMLKNAPTEALVEVLAQLRAQNRAAQPATSASDVLAPQSEKPSLHLQPGEASALMDIVSMLDSAPTEALESILTRLRAHDSDSSIGEGGRPAALLAGQRSQSDASGTLPTPMVADGKTPSVEALATATPAQAAAMRSGRAMLLRHLLQCYFRANAPEALPKVENLVARVVGGAPSVVEGVGVGGVLWTEAELFRKLEAKYGAKVELDPQVVE